MMWPYRGLDPNALAAAGWRPTPFREFVLKISQRCNLACDYCYVYTKDDQTWRTRPSMMSTRTCRFAATRIAEHVRRHGLEEVRVVLHGGEPLLVGAERLATIASTVRARVPPGRRVEVVAQTNGVLLGRRALDVLRRNRIDVGVSLDGPATDNDRHRRFANGQGSHAAVDRALRLLGEPGFRGIFAGVLCTVDLRSDPIACYESILDYRPPSIDFLLPHANWADPPPSPDDTMAPTYADWLIAVFDRWYRAPRQETHIRIFEEIINLLLGGASRSEQIGLSPVAVVVVESDGDIEQVDTLKSAYSGAAATGLNVRHDCFDAALRHPGIVARQIGVAALCDTCRSCPVHRICGAGNYAHRYRPGHGFRNPSVYCGDLRRLVEHIGGVVRAGLADLCRGAA